MDGHSAIMQNFELRERMIPCISLRNLLEVECKQPGYERIVVTEADGFSWAWLWTQCSGNSTP